VNEEVGINELCWCGSGEKFEKCHLNRENEEALSRSDLERHGKSINSVGVCSVSDANKAECSGKIVHAHTISKSGSLKKIAVDGHVMGTKPSLSELFENDGRIGLSKVGINKASTFTGFCTNHDKKLFAPLEDHPITLSDEQLFLLAYRSLSRELYGKQANEKNTEFIKLFDRGQPVETQALIQHFASILGTGVDLALTDLKYIKGKMDSMLQAADFSGINHLIIKLSANPKILVSASTQPEFSFDGERLQSLADLKKKLSHIVFNCIAYENSGCFVFSWIDDHDHICRKFVDSLVKLENQDIGNALVRFCYSYAENTWASPMWWESLSEEKKSDISDRLQHGLLIPITLTCLKNNGLNFDAFEVSGTELRSM